MSVKMYILNVVKGFQDVTHLLMVPLYTTAKMEILFSQFKCQLKLCISK